MNTKKKSWVSFETSNSYLVKFKHKPNCQTHHIPMLDHLRSICLIFLQLEGMGTIIKYCLGCSKRHQSATAGFMILVSVLELPKLTLD